MRSEDINEYLKDATGGDFSAKDFRTWNATALAAVALAVSGASRDDQDRAQAARSTARSRRWRGYLGNTPAVCRASYIDPRVFDAFDAGLTIRPALERVAQELEPGELPIHQPALEARGAGPDRRARVVARDRAGRRLAREAAAASTARP